MSRTTLHSLTLVLALCVVLAGCSALGDDPTRDDRAVDALENSTAALEAAETYQYESEVTVSGGGQRIDVSAVGTVDVDERAMFTNTTHDGETRGVYVIEDTAYTECQSPWSGWGVEEFEEDYWPAETPAHSQLSMFETGDLHWNGTETVDDREVVRLTGSPSADALDDGTAGATPVFDFGGPSIDETSATLLIDAETDRPLETTLEFTVSNGGETASGSITTRYDAYDEDVSIDLPYEATVDQYELGCPGA